MKRKDFNVIHATAAVQALSRAGRNAGVTNVGGLCGVTPERSRTVLCSALKIGLVCSYGNVYRPNVTRTCYALTETGRIVLGAIEQHKKSKLWGLSGE